MKNNILRKDISRYSKYIPVESAEGIAARLKVDISKIDKLDAGENVWGPSPRVIKALYRFRGYQYYPDPEYVALRNAISEYTAVNTKNIFVSNGGDEIIDLILRLVLDRDDMVISAPPTFSSYMQSTILNRGVMCQIPRKKDFAIDCEKIIKALTSKTKIVFICNPNNPTGSTTTLDEIVKILDTGVLVCVDEAYIEYGGESCIGLLDRYENLIIIRSFSKWAGIAGLRLGYGLMSDSLVKQLMKIKSPYNVNYAAVIAGIAALKDGTYRKKTLKKIIDERERMYLKLKGIDVVTVYPSSGNFLYLETTKSRMKAIKDKFTKASIAVRYFESELTGDALRITIGKPMQNKKVLDIFKKLI